MCHSYVCLLLCLCLCTPRVCVNVQYICVQSEPSAVCVIVRSQRVLVSVLYTWTWSTVTGLEGNSLVRLLPACFGLLLGTKSFKKRKSVHVSIRECLCGKKIIRTKWQSFFFVLQNLFLHSAFIRVQKHTFHVREFNVHKCQPHHLGLYAVPLFALPPHP